MKSPGLFRLFAFLMAAGTLFHQAQLGDWHPLSHHTVVSLSAIWLLLRPSSLPRFLAMSAVQLGSWALDLPEVVNHSMMLALTNGAVFVCLATLVWRDGLHEAGDPNVVYGCVAPIVRIHLVLVYAFATLAKFNHGFLDPRLSCAVTMYADVPFVPRGEWTAAPAIFSTMLIEGGLAVLLASRRTRLGAVFLGSAFHVMLAFAGHVPFSGFALALYVPFLPASVPARFQRCLEYLPWLAGAGARVAAWANSWLTFPALAAVWVLTGCGITFGWIPGPVVRLLLGPGLLTAFVTFAMGLALMLLLCVRQRGSVVYEPGAFHLPHAVCLLGPLLMVLNGLSPYLGLKTQSSFAMYSNLRTEGERWNHLFLPAAMRIFPFQDDLVTIEDSSDRRLAQSAREGNQWVSFQFREYLSGRGEASVTYEQAGARAVVRRVTDDPILSDRPNLVLRKLLWFREVVPAERNTCQH